MAIDRSPRWMLLLVALGISACGDARATTDERAVERAPLAAPAAPPTSAAPTTSLDTTTSSIPPPPPLPPVAPTPAPAAPPAPRAVHHQGWAPYATVGPVTLHHPADQVEAIGYHQSGHDGAQPQAALTGSARSFTMDGRGRDTHPQGAADLVVQPDREIRSPVTGTVRRAGTYTLYCDHVDQYAVIEPDARPGWEVKVLHIQGLALTAGQRVEAGVTRLAAGARVLPFPSQVEDDTGRPAWPHVHIEVVDPTVPDRPGGPGCP